VAIRKRAGDRNELPELLAAILQSQGAVLTRRGSVWEGALPAPLAQSLGTDRVRLVASPAGRAARGAEMDAALTEKILLLGRSQGEVTRLVARIPYPRGAEPLERHWIRLHWRIRYGSDDLPEELLAQHLPIGSSGGLRVPPEIAFRAPTAEESAAVGSPDPELLAAAWMRALRQLESRIRQKLRPHEDRMRRELHREMRSLSVHFRSLIAEERTGRRRRPESREAGRILQLKEDWERKLAAVIRQRVLDTEAKLVAAAFLTVIPEGKGGAGLTRGRRGATLAD
jgi:hypothetical protein